MLPVLLLLSSFSAGPADRFAACLPEGVKLEEVVSIQSLKSAGGSVGKNVTINDTLLRLQARCAKGKLVDGGGREVRIHRLIGCWGNPPEDYLEQQARQIQELAQLRKKYTVLEIPCALDPTKVGPMR